MDLSKDDVLKILKLIDDSGYDDVRLEIGDFKLHVQKQGAATTARDERPQRIEPPAAPPAAAPQPAAAAKPAQPAPSAPAQQEVPAGMVAVRSPMLGTFYRAPSPGEKPFVEVGSRVTADDTVCLVEVMKLFSSVKAGVTGRVSKIVVENGAMVEHEQLLILIEPDKS